MEENKTPEDKAWDDKYNANNYTKTIYSFTASELARLAPWDTQIQLARFAEIALTGVIRNDCLKRVGAKNIVDSGIRYDINTGQFIVYQPKVLCSMCKNRKAEFSYQDRVFCQSCADTLKKTVPQAAKEPEKKHANSTKGKASVKEEQPSTNSAR